LRAGDPAGSADGGGAELPSGIDADVMDRAWATLQQAQQLVVVEMPVGD
jgi:hypothetical protein